MTREEFDNLVRRVEHGVGRQPTALRWRVGLLAVAGYAGLLAWLGIMVLVSAGFFAAMFWTDSEGKIVCAVAGTVVLFGGGWMALRALLVRVPPPEGRLVTRAEVPELFAILGALQNRPLSA